MRRPFPKRSPACEETPSYFDSPEFYGHRAQREPENGKRETCSSFDEGGPHLETRNSKLETLRAIAGVVPASQLERPALPVVSFGVPVLDELTGGLPRGALTEICGPASSGRSSLMLAALAEATRRHETCALVDACDSFDPHSAAAAGADLDRILWVRCGGNFDLRISNFDLDNAANGVGQQKSYSPRRHGATDEIKNSKQIKIQNSQIKIALEQALRVTDLLLQGGGFGLVAVDLAGIPPEWARRVPLASWFRFRRAVEPTSTVLLVLEREPYAKTCASLVLRTSANTPAPRATAGSASPPTHAQLFLGIHVQVELIRSRLENKKPAGKVEVQATVEGVGT